MSLCPEMKIQILNILRKKYLHVSLLSLINFHNIYTIGNFLLQRLIEANSLLKS